MQVKARVKDKNLIDEKRRQIIEGAIKVFKKKGYHKATVREIASEAKIGLGSIYDYVSSKDDILYLFFENYVTTFFDKVRSRAFQIVDPYQRLEVTFRAFVEAAMELEDQVMLAYTQARYVKKNYLKVILRKESEVVEHFRKILSEVGDDSIDPFLEANFLVFSGVFGVLRRWILKPHYDHREIIDFLVQRQLRELSERIKGRKKLSVRARPWPSGITNVES
ncbi:MAG: TetR/AcrR family transcriptional regulator [Deltaproteobacteria bacterium]|nr:TetR/AcrR family transcriptional regulator [Deltaproteobacteria bacterium]